MALGWRGSYSRYKEFFLNITALYKKKAELRAFLEIILSLSTIIIFLLFALKPTVITIVSLLQQIREKQDTLSGLTQKVSDLQKANNRLTHEAYFGARTYRSWPGTEAVPSLRESFIYDGYDKAGGRDLRYRTTIGLDLDFKHGLKLNQRYSLENSRRHAQDSDALRFSTDTPTLLIAVSIWFWRAPSFARKVETCPIAASMDCSSASPAACCRSTGGPGPTPAWSRSRSRTSTSARNAIRSAAPSESLRMPALRMIASAR